MPPLTLHIARYPSGLSQPPHAHDALHLSLVLQGAVVESIGGESRVVCSMGVVSKDPGVVHADRWGEGGAVMARLSITGQGLRDLADDRQFDRAWSWTEDMRVAAPFLRLVSRARVSDSGLPPDDTDVTDLVAVLTRGNEGAVEVSRQPGSGKRWP